MVLIENLNNYRLSNSFISLTSNSNITTKNKNLKQTKISLNLKFKNKLETLYSLPAPYEIKKGVRFIRGSDKLVSEKLKIMTIDNFNNKSIFASISECSKSLKINRSKINKCLLTGEIYNNCQFIVFNENNLKNI